MKNGKISAAAANLFPGYFALVMATGIISIATHLLNMTPIAWTLLIVNLVAYPILTLLLLIRLILFFPRVATDVAGSPARSRLFYCRRRNMRAR